MKRTRAVEVRIQAVFPVSSPSAAFAAAGAPASASGKTKGGSRRSRDRSRIGEGGARSLQA
jgi:hypothetical protein